MVKGLRIAAQLTALAALSLGLVLGTVLLADVLQGVATRLAG